jgi:hypothetical protein
MCVPPASPLYDAGEEHGAAEPSRAHKSVTPASASAKDSSAPLLAVAPSGRELIAGTGGAVVSMAHVAVRAALVFPTPSRAETENVCEPSARLV